MKPRLSMLVAALAFAAHANAAPAASPAGATAPDTQRLPLARKPAAATRDAGPAREAPAAWWYDRGVRRPLHVDRDWIADFADRPAAAAHPGRRASPLRQRDGVEKDSGALPPGASPVFRDAGGAARALPGGVLVRLRDADLRRARERLAAAGLTPVRANDPEGRTWLVESPPGLPALELANRLHESGEFESVEPNWWRPRALK
jgi:hypothetical protein